MQDEVVDRLERTAAQLEGLMGSLEERQRLLDGEVERISATVETSRREEALEARVEELERELATLRALAAEASGQGLPKALEGLRRTLPSGTAEMLAKHGIGESAVEVKALDAALAGLSLEQRIAVKSQLRRAGAMS